MLHRTLAFALAFLLVTGPLKAAQNSLGVVTQSNGGHLNNAAASAGATLYIGDRLGTDSKGAWFSAQEPCSRFSPKTAFFS